MDETICRFALNFKKMWLLTLGETICASSQTQNRLHSHTSGTPGEGEKHLQSVIVNQSEISGRIPLIPKWRKQTLWLERWNIFISSIHIFRWFSALIHWHTADNLEIRCEKESLFLCGCSALAQRAVCSCSYSWMNPDELSQCFGHRLR